MQIFVFGPEKHQRAPPFCRPGGRLPGLDAGLQRLKVVQLDHQRRIGQEVESLGGGSQRPAPRQHGQLGAGPKLVVLQTDFFSRQTIHQVAGAFEFFIVKI